MTGTARRDPAGWSIPAFRGRIRPRRVAWWRASRQSMKQPSQARPWRRSIWSCSYRACAPICLALLPLRAKRADWMTEAFWW